MIHLDQNSAALFAQVLPVLTLVLLLEGRVPLKRYRSGATALVLEGFRFVTVLYGTTATLVCLYIVGAKTESVLPADILITLGFWLIAIATVLLAVLLCWGPIRDAFMRSLQETTEPPDQGH